MNFKKYLLKISSFVSLPLVSLASISCSNNQNVPPVDYEMINKETNGLAFNSKGEITKFYNYGGSTDINLVIPEYLVNNSISTSEYYGYKQRITRIGLFAFSSDSVINDQYQWAKYLNSVILPNSIETIGANAFYGTSLKKINIPDSVLSIGDEAFKYCKDLTNVKLSKSIKYIGSSAFAGTAITNIEFPTQNLSEIKFRAFDGTKLSGSLYIPDSVKLIDQFAFRGTQIIEISVHKDCEIKQDAIPSGCVITRRPQQ